MGAPISDFSTSLASSLKSMKFGFCSVQGVHSPPCLPLGSLYLAKLVHAVSIFSERSQSPFVQGRQQCLRDLNTNQRSEEWKAPLNRLVTSGREPSSGRGRANSYAQALPPLLWRTLQNSAIPGAMSPISLRV